MLLFWIAAALLSAAAAALVLWRARGADATPAEAPELAVYRRHLEEQDELKARGLLGEMEWKAARAEAGRRLLAAAAPTEPAPPADARKQGLIVLIAVLAASALAMIGYSLVGSPGAPDQSYASRLKAWRAADPATLRPAEAAAVLSDLAAEHPTNPDAWSFLGRARAQAGDYFGAAQALERAVALRPGSASDWTALGEMLTELNEGKPDVDATRAFRRALAIDPAAPGPRYYLGRAELAAGRKAEGLKLWREAAAALAADDPRRPALEAEIRAAETGAPASPAAEIAAAAPAAQQAAIRGMVANLAARLETTPDDPQGWARLVRAYAVLGETAARDQALARARTLFKDRPADLRAIEAAARPTP